ncbi:hypothetical protein GKC56_05805 [Neisseriaceae bacterium PsAf]|nr:hypothetical protein [Neisseriaceae bacterium PsAf]
MKKENLLGLLILCSMGYVNADSRAVSDASIFNEECFLGTIGIDNEKCLINISSLKVPIQPVTENKKEDE